MTDKRAAMTLNRTFLTVLLATSLAACSNNPLMRTSQATSTDAAQSIETRWRRPKPNPRCSVPSGNRPRGQVFRKKSVRP